MTSSRYEDSCELSVQTAGSPEATSGVPKGLYIKTCALNHIHSGQKKKGTHLPLCREVTVTSGDTKKERIESGEFLGVDDFVDGFRRCVHLREDFLREGLGDSVVMPML